MLTLYLSSNINLPHENMMQQYHQDIHEIIYLFIFIRFHLDKLARYLSELHA
jgi:hypothetical protein